MKRARTAFGMMLILLAVLTAFAGCGERGREPQENPEGDMHDAPGTGREAAEQEAVYVSASELLEQAEKNGSYKDYCAAFDLFRSIDGYRESHDLAELCCDGYIRVFYGEEKYLNFFGQYDKILSQLYTMSGYGAADDFASVTELLRAGEYRELLGRVTGDPSFCGRFRAEAGGLLWRYVKSMSEKLSFKKFGFQTELDDTIITACAAKHLGGSAGEGGSGTGGDSFSGGKGCVQDCYITDSIYEKILADCGADAAGKVFVTRVIHPYQYSAGAALLSNTEYCLAFTAMEKLPDELFPSSAAEAEYIIQCESKYQFVGEYDHGTDAVREYTTVKLIRFPDGELLSETTVYGDDPPETIEYTGNPPAYRSGGKPSDEEVFAAITQYCSQIAGTN